MTGAGRLVQGLPGRGPRSPQRASRRQAPNRVTQHEDMHHDGVMQQPVMSPGAWNLDFQAPSSHLLTLLLIFLRSPDRRRLQTCAKSNCPPLLPSFAPAFNPTNSTICSCYPRRASIPTSRTRRCGIWRPRDAPRKVAQSLIVYLTSCLSHNRRPGIGRHANDLEKPGKLGPVRARGLVPDGQRLVARQQERPVRE